MNVPLMLVLGAAALAAWALVFRGMDQALPDRTRDLRRRLASGAQDRPQRERGAPVTRQPLHPALAVAFLLAVLAVGILIGQERQGLGATQDPTTEVVGDQAGAGTGSDDEASDREESDRGSDREAPDKDRDREDADRRAKDREDKDD
jgi:hypothetical protein